MLFILGKPQYIGFTTHNPTTGNVQDADSLPTAQVFEEDRGDPIHTPVVTKISGQTGLYMVRLELTTGNEFELDKSYNVIVGATVESITAKSRIAQFTLDKIPVRDLADVQYRVRRPRKGSKEEVWERIKP